MKFKVGDKVRFSEKIKDHIHNPIVKFDNVERKIIDVDNQYQLEGLPNNWFFENELQLVDFTIDDLQFADIVTARNGKRYVVADGYLYSEVSDSYLDSCFINSWYNDDLTTEDNFKDYDIVKVERAGNVIYEREETKVKEMTLEEISKELGYEVRIVKGD